MAKKIIKGKHRNAALAQRHAAALAREHGGEVKIVRRNASGQFSARGKHYSFEIVKPARKRKASRKPVAAKKPTGKQIEYVAHFDYGEKKSRNLIRFQVHFFAPEGLPDSRVISIIKKWESDGTVPQGWRYEIIFWGHPKERRDKVKVSFPEKKFHSPRLYKALKKNAIETDEGIIL